MPALRAVVFDLGHTLWDFAPRDGARRLAVLRLHARLEATLSGIAPSPAALDQALGATVESWLESWNSDRLDQPPSERLVGEALATLDVTLPTDVLRDLTAILFATEVDMPVMAPDGLAAIATLQQRGLTMGCITNTILLEEGILDALRRLGLVRYLQSIVVSSAMGYRKPHPSLFLRALEELGVASQDAVFVGDRLADDIGGAQAVGMRAVLTHQYRQEPLDGVRLRQRTPDAVIGRLSELPGVLDRLEAEE